MQAVSAAKQTRAEWGTALHSCIVAQRLPAILEFLSGLLLDHALLWKLSPLMRARSRTKWDARECSTKHLAYIA
jgi:hypothetical protein